MKTSHLIIGGIALVGGYYLYTHRASSTAAPKAATPSSSILGVFQGLATNIAGSIKGALGGGAPPASGGSSWDFGSGSATPGSIFAGILDSNTAAPNSNVSAGYTSSTSSLMAPESLPSSPLPSTLDDLVNGDSFQLS